MTADMYDPGEAIPCYLSYLPYLAVELDHGGRSDLAARVRQEGEYTLAEFENIIRAGLELGSGIALEVAKRQRVAQLILEAEAWEAVPGLFDEILRLVETHWEVQFEKRRYRSFEAKEKYGEFVKRVLDLEKEFPPIFEITARLDELDDLAEFGFERLLREYAEELGTFNANDMDRLLSELPEDFQAAFDSMWRDRLEADFLTAHGDDAIELINDREELWQAWDEAFVPVARDFLINVYSGEIRSADSS